MNRAMLWGRDRMEEARLDRSRRADPVAMAAQQRQYALAQRAQAEAAQNFATQRYQSKLTRAASRARTGGYLAAGAAGLGLVDVVTGIGAPGLDGVVPAGPGMWFVAAAVSGFIALRARAKVRHPAPPPQVPLPAVPPPLLAPGTVGAEECAEVLRAESQLHAMLPAVDALHTGAGDSLRATLNSVEPRMHGLIERLELVAGIDAIRAPQAAEAAETLRRRLGQGALAYDRLIDATATLLAAPDPAGTATDSLAIATAELEAYAAGLGAASDVFDEH